MSYKTEYRQTPNYWLRGTKPTEIVIHHWGADGQTHNGVVSWLCNRNSGVSAHYVVSGGRVTQLANTLSQATWHAGNRAHNMASIGIECRPEHTADDQQTVAELVANLWKMYGVLPIKEHRQIVSTACPGRWNANIVYSQAMAIYKRGVTKVETSSNTALVIDGLFGYKSCVKMQKWLGCSTVDGELSNQRVGQKTYIRNMDYCTKYDTSGYSTAVKKLQKVVGSTQDGLLGANTIKALQKYLNKQGYKLSVDGIAGVNTCKAFQQYLNKVA